MLTPVSMELRTPPLVLKMPRAVATTVWLSSSSSSSKALGLEKERKKQINLIFSLIFNFRFSLLEKSSYSRNVVSVDKYVVLLIVIMDLYSTGTTVRVKCLLTKKNM